MVYGKVIRGLVVIQKLKLRFSLGKDVAVCREANCLRFREPPFGLQEHIAALCIPRCSKSKSRPILYKLNLINVAFKIYN